ncbi:AT-hook motif nuclear-localized protein 9 [Oryza sativa Japonica Group]|uniref:AT-hook motif nuclear-localized protein n=6 Tax=Oryza TaxID=4527 RepID=Q0J8W7_ORYSJ|nr:AT-hook motif nuclear-localized protein 9 [Oryza sativa Japonica Group]XP_052152352.1 AT-hook motif nuclear-localized protein 9-like [Oryza glaberrima]EEC78282.1 hypothetical protein OsI_17980 [Oryza sativa Indica Group]KAB8097577.1 hypothetical protein EE612_026349 [Oryza sativa]KAB8097578.1 hypothetical protein EE612_026349 [Oryza sativa]KAF2936609.1 hypothetical protein DAI22_04g314700 [Oryza sativa Japonica Group]BAF16220.1 Os04g0683900 [Oryza sativa Japonica Group]|eukprot:NP_001054306.1 Os04g0683900 [Oryza sativa Japonica Group]
MDGKELLSPSELSYYAHQQHQHQHQQHQQQHRMLGGGGGGGGHSASPLAGMHGGPSVIRPMPNMGMSPTAILQSIGPGPLAGMQFQMDAAPPPPPLMHNSMASVSASAGAGSPTVPPSATPMEPVKRKRGRPRKYGPDGTMKVSTAAAAQHQQQMLSAPPRMGSVSGADMVGGGSGMDDSAQKKRRGRPPGTGKKQQLSSPVKLSGGNAFSGSAGTSFTPHIITASPSEDVAGKIVAFANHSSRAVCVLSATGSVSRVVLRHPADGAMSRVHASSHYKNPAIYEGLYEILSMSGCYNLMNEGQSDGLSVTLCSPERHIIGGVLGGALVAASTVQVVLGSFVQGGSKPKSKKAGKQQQQQAAAAAFSSDSLTGGGQDASPSSGHNQNLTPPPPVTTTGGWPSSGIFDTRSSNIDINSSRG